MDRKLINQIRDHYDAKVYPGESWEVEADGVVYSVTIDSDVWDEKPWEESDGHGPVYGPERREKRPYELMLTERDGGGRLGFHYFYDFAEAVKIARREGWGYSPGETKDMKPGQRAELAARADFEYLKAWCEGRWQYVSVSVSVKGMKCSCCHQAVDVSRSLGGVDSCCDRSYIDEIVQDLIGELSDEVEQMDSRIHATN